ncbi:MAG: Tfp pilus assembly protein FimT/FimU [Phycisphaerales bacterium JB064]
MSRAFTLVELLVTLVIVGLILGLAVPRVATLGGRGVSAEADAIAGLLSSAAGRASVASQPLRVRAEANTVVVERRELEKSGSREYWVWRRDPFMPPVRMNRGSVTGVYANGQAVSGSPWIVELGGGRSVEVVLAGSESGVSVALMAGALRAIVVEGDRLIEPPGRIDLDASGMESSPW